MHFLAFYSVGYGQYLVLGVFVEAVQCHMPANGESVTITTVPTVPVDVSLSLLKRTMSDTGESTDCFVIFLSVICIKCHTCSMSCY